ncbi:unnamed protein product [Symbiodinium sp. CCMP2456]|nr:unnamed protein product [Symbiodinium sp. CCMP2456]
MASAAQQAAMEVPLPTPLTDWADESDDYDEQLQEDVFLGKVDLTSQLEIKNTFYNLPVMSSMTSEDDTDNPWQSAPTVMCVTAWRTKWPNMEAAHNRGECKPCAYFLYKPDGCRNSDDCPYCHLCRKGEIKRRKRKKIKELKVCDYIQQNRLYDFANQLLYDHFASEDDGIKFLDRNTLWLDVVLKLFFFASVWQAAMDALILVQEGSNRVAREALMLGPDRYEELYFYFTTLGKDVFFPGLVQGGAMDTSQLEALVSKDLTMRGLSMLALLIRMFITTGGMYLNLKSLPPRHPQEPLNQMRYYMAYFELIALGWFWSVLVYRLMMWTQTPNLSYMGLILANAAEDIASWSSMQLLRNISLSRLSQRVTRVTEECKLFFNPKMQYVMAPFEALGYIAAGLFGIVVLAIKTTQIEFVSKTLANDYSLQQWFRLISFAMSMVSIFNLDEESRFAVQRFLLHPFENICTGSQMPSPVFLAWEQKLAAEISAKKGFWAGFVFMATLKADDYQKLLLPRMDEEAPPKLLHDLLTANLLSKERGRQAVDLGMREADVEELQKWAASETSPAKYFASRPPDHIPLMPLSI